MVNPFGPASRILMVLRSVSLEVLRSCFEFGRVTICYDDSVSHCLVVWVPAASFWNYHFNSSVGPRRVILKFPFKFFCGSLAQLAVVPPRSFLPVDHDHHRAAACLLGLLDS